MNLAQGEEPGHLRVPFLATNDLLMLVAANAPHAGAAIRATFSIWWCASPFRASSFALSFVHIFDGTSIGT